MVLFLPRDLESFGCLKHFVLCIEASEHGVAIVGVEVDELDKGDVAAHELLLSGVEHGGHVGVECR